MKPNSLLSATSRSFALGLSAGIVLCAGAWLSLPQLVQRAQAASTSSPKVSVTLYKYRIKEGKLDRFAEWMRWHHQQHAGLVETLGPEHMYVEAIFRDRDDDPRTFYWLTVQGQGGQVSSQSATPLDKVHTEYGREVIEYPRRTLTTETDLIPAFILRAIESHQTQVPPLQP